MDGVTEDIKKFEASTVIHSVNVPAAVSRTVAVIIRLLCRLREVFVLVELSDVHKVAWDAVAAVRANTEYCTKPAPAPKSVILILAVLGVFDGAIRIVIGASGGGTHGPAGGPTYPMLQLQDKISIMAVWFVEVSSGQIVQPAADPIEDLYEPSAQASQTTPSIGEE